MTVEDRNIIKEIRALTGLKDSQVADVFKSLSHVCGLGSYYNNESIAIPYFGTFKLRFEGDEIDDISGLRKAKVTGFFSLHEDVKKNVGLIEDYRETGNDKLITDIDAFKTIKHNTRQALKQTTEG